MSGPMQPGMNNILRMPMGQSKKARGDDRPPGVMPPGQSSEPVQRSPYSARILAARRLGVEPNMIEQQPGYRPGQKGNSMIPPRQAAPKAAPQAAPAPAPEPAPAPVAEGVPLPRPRPAGASAISPQDFMRQALEMEAAKQRQQQVPVKPGAPVSSPEEFKQKLAELQYRQQTGNKPPVSYSVGGWGTPKTTAQSPVWDRGSVPTPGIPSAQAMPSPQVREATPDEIKTAQQNDMARGIATARSGGEQRTAPAAQGVVTPPAPSVSPSPAAPPPPVRETFRPITRPDAEYIVRDPAAEKEREKDKKKPQKSTYKEKAGSSPRYYEILKVPYGDNRLASQALSKLRAKADKDPGSVTMEEDALLAATNEDPVYNKSRLPEAVQKRMTSKGTGDNEKEDTGRPKFDPGTARPGDRTSVAVPTSEANTTVLQYIPPVRGDQRRSAVDPAQVQAYAAIDQAGQPPVKRLPTQEDVNMNPKAYKADVDTDDVPEE